MTESSVVVDNHEFIALADSGGPEHISDETYEEHPYNGQGLHQKLPSYSQNPTKSDPYFRVSFHSVKFSKHELMSTIQYVILF